MQALQKSIKTCFENWRDSEVIGRAGISNREIYKDELKDQKLNWITLNALLKTEADIQMRFGSFLDDWFLKNHNGQYFVRSEAKFKNDFVAQDETSDLATENSEEKPIKNLKTIRIDLAVYKYKEDNKNNKLWDSTNKQKSPRCTQCGVPGPEAIDHLLAVIEVKLLSWKSPTDGHKFGGIFSAGDKHGEWHFPQKKLGNNVKIGGIEKDIHVLNMFKNDAVLGKDKDILRFHLVIDESAGTKSGDQKMYERLWKAWDACGIIPLTNIAKAGTI